MKIALVVFTRNERKNSELIYDKIPQNVVDKIYVVDGDSVDGTQEFWENKHIKVYLQKYKGIGGAYETSFRLIPEDALIFFHPDGNMDPQDIKKFVKLFKDGHQIIIATRMTKDGINEEDDQLLKPRKWFNQTLMAIINILWGRSSNKGSDLTQGYRAMTRNAYNKLKIKIPPPNASDTQQVIRALKFGVPITEFPTKEGKRIYGETAFPSLKTGLDQLKLLWRELVP